jgi:hypothetical protein
MIRRSFFKALSTLAALPVVGKLLPEPKRWVTVMCVWDTKKGVYETWIDDELVSVEIITPQKIYMSRIDDPNSWDYSKDA